MRKETSYLEGRAPLTLRSSHPCNLNAKTDLKGDSCQLFREEKTEAQSGEVNYQGLLVSIGIPGLSGNMPGREGHTSTAPLASRTHVPYHFTLLAIPGQCTWEKSLHFRNATSETQGCLCFSEEHRANKWWRCDSNEGLSDYISCCL